MKALVATVAVFGLTASPVLACEWMKSAERESETVSIMDTAPKQTVRQSEPEAVKDAGRVQITETPSNDDTPRK